MDIESKELEEYVCSTLSAIRKGLESANFNIANVVEFDLAVTNSREGGGGLKIYVANAEGKLKSEEVSHIKFQARPNLPQQSFRPTVSGNPAR